jgi:glycosyltransferase involved in cell wall biosynthesis
MLRIGYLMSRFPRLTETFILYEILALRRRGVQVEIYPLLRERKTRVHPDGASVLRKAVDLLSREEREVVMHPDARPLLPQVHYSPLLTLGIVATNLRQVIGRPLAYIAALVAIVRHNMGSPNYLLGGLATFPLAVSMGAKMRRSGIVHLHAHFANHPAAAAFVINRLFGIPYSFTGHGADLQVDQHMLGAKVEAAAFVRAISEDGRKFIAAHAPAGSTTELVVVPCGIDTRSFDGGAGHESVGTPTTLLCVATLYEVKGHAYLFEACARLVAAGHDLRCLLVGDGPDRSVLEQHVARLDLSQRISFLGQRVRTEIVRLMHEADILVVPSVPTSSGRREGLPVVLMEGMAAGLPVIASAISGIPELIEHDVTGLLVPPKDPDALASAIVRLIDDPELRRSIIAGGRRRVRDEYDLDVIGAKLTRLFEDHAVSRPGVR